MKRYILFAGRDYEPLGGAGDIMGSDCDIESLKETVKIFQDRNRYDWYQIYDCELEQVIWSGEN